MKRVKIFLAIIIATVFCFALAACGDQAETPDSGNQDETQQNGDNTGNNDSSESDSKILIAYFSCTNNTKGIAQYVAEITGGTLYEITPAVPYTEDDLKYYTDCRADREQADSTCRPEISGSVENMSEYDIVYIGYPIWHSQAPKLIYTFLESYDFSGKIIVPFCTSASSGVGSSATNLHSSASSATWKDGRRFASSAAKSSVEDWINGLGL